MVDLTVPNPSGGHCHVPLEPRTRDLVEPITLSAQRVARPRLERAT